VTRDPRQRRLDEMLGTLQGTEAGRSLGLGTISTFDDLRASVPLMDPQAHADQVEQLLGFGVAVDPEMLTAAARERARLRTVWASQLGSLGEPEAEASGAPEIVIIGPAMDDPRVDAIRIDDLRTLPGPPPTIERVGDADAPALVQRLSALAPRGLVLPSLATCGWLEGVVRKPIERHLASLSWLMAEHDLHARVRSRLPVLNAGWIHAAGRIALPSERSRSELVMATDSTLIELLPHGDPVEDSGGGRDETTVLPEHAVMGEGYELVLSSPLGFVRYRSGQHVQIVGFEGATEPWLGRPRPRVQRIAAPPPDVKLEGMTVPGAWLTAALRQAFQPEDPALVAAEIGPDLATKDLSSGQTTRARINLFAETELGSDEARRAGRNPRAVQAWVEVQGASAPDLGEGLAKRMDEALLARSAPYRYLRSRGELLEPRVVVAPGGTAKAARLKRLEAHAGTIDVPQIQVHT
jgi:hypothetical protein